LEYIEELIRDDIDNQNFRLGSAKTAFDANDINYQVSHNPSPLYPLNHHFRKAD